MKGGINKKLNSLRTSNINRNSKMSNEKITIKTKDCWRGCGATVYTISGRFSPFTGKYGPILQDYDDLDGTIEHWTTCPNYKGRKQSDKAQDISNKVIETTPAQKITAESAQLAQKNLSIHEQQIQEEKAAKTAQEYSRYANMQTDLTKPSPEEINNPNKDLEANYRHLVLKNEIDITKIKETLADMSNSIELIALKLGVTLPGREPKPVGVP